MSTTYTVSDWMKSIFQIVSCLVSMHSIGNIIIIIMEAKMTELDDAMKLIIDELQPQDQITYQLVRLTHLHS
jgi:hypothetical protein